jgi:hypothetical protein
MQFADIKFEPVIDSTNGKPPEFNYTNEEFAKIHCPVIRFAFAVNGFSQGRLREFVQEMVTPDGEDGDHAVRGPRRIHQDRTRAHDCSCVGDRRGGRAMSDDPRRTRQKSVLTNSYDLMQKRFGAGASGKLRSCEAGTATHG